MEANYLLRLLLTTATLTMTGLSGHAALVYSNDFSGPAGSLYPEWASSSITYQSATNPPVSGELPAPPVSNTQSPNGAQRFLGEFGGPPIGQPGDPGWNHTRVDQTVRLSLTNLPPHASLTLTFDLYVLKSWDGNSPAYGPDRFTLNIADGPTLLDTTFSNNPKTNTDRSYQNYPSASSPPWTGAFATNTLGYGNFFYDATYRLRYTFLHAASHVTINFKSSLFEGKGTADESWGLDNVTVVASPGTNRAGAVPAPRNLLVLPQTQTDSSLVLFWDKPEEHQNVSGYEVYQEGKTIGATPSDKTFFAVNGLKPGTSYTFYIVTKDVTNERSSPSASVRISTLPKGPVIDVTAPPYNAKGDGVTKNTAAIQKAIDQCPANGTVSVPAGTFLTGALVLKNDMTFYVASGGVLKGSTDTNDYLPMIWTRYMGVECSCFQPLIRIGVMDHRTGFTTRHVTLCGKGEIRGGGETLGLQESYDHRSRLILIQNCQDVAIMDLHLTYPAGWTIHPLYSDNVTAWNVWIESWDAKKGKSGDGFDPDSCSNCYLVNSVLHTWDNSFSPKSGRNLEGIEIGRPTKHVRVAGCTLESGAPSLGSEVSGGIEDVVVRDSKIVKTYFYIKTNDGRGGYIRDFAMENVGFEGNSPRAIWVDTNYEVRNRPPKAPVHTDCGRYVFTNLRGCGSITLDGDFQRGEGPPRNDYIHDVSFSNVEMRPGAEISLKYCSRVKFENVRCADGQEPQCLLNQLNYNVTVNGKPLTAEP